MSEIKAVRRLMISATTLAIGLLAAAPVAAQQDPDAPKPYVYGIYYECDVARQELADEIVELVFAPAFDAAVEAGTIQSWGWLSHHTGGKWRRLMYHTAPDLTTLMAALEKVIGPVGEKHPELSRAFAEVCGTHDDYVWQLETGSRGGDITAERGEAGFSVYMECEMDEEDRADELVAEVFAPIYDRQVTAGALKSWGWMSHVVGGEWRRLLTMTAADHTGLLATRAKIIAEIMEKHEQAGTEFDGICDSHQDYMWNIVHETP